MPADVLARRFFIGVGLLLSALVVACESLPELHGKPDVLDMKPRLSEVELRTRLEDYSVRFSGQVQTAADEVAAMTPDPELRRSAVAWKLRLITECRTALQTANEVAVLLNVWTLCVQMDNFFTAKQDVPALEAVRPRVKQAATDLLADIQGVAHEAFSDKLFDKVKLDVDEFAQSNPLAPGAVRKPYRVPTAGAAGGHYSAMLSVLAVPLAPFNVVKGIDDSAAAIHHLAEALDRASAAAQDLPEEACWRAELLLYDAEGHPAARSLVASMDRASIGIETLSQSSERLSTAIEKAPADVQHVIDTTLERSAAVQSDLRTTITQADQTLQRLENVSTDIRGVTQDLEKTATAVGGAGSAWQGTFESFRGMVADMKGKDDATAPTTAPPAAATSQTSGESGGFDIKDYDKTANSIAGAAEELRGLLVELRGLLHPDELGRALDQAHTTAQSSIQFTSGEAVSLADHVAKRAAQLLGLFFAGLIVYRIISVRVARK